MATADTQQMDVDDVESNGSKSMPDDPDVAMDTEPSTKEQTASDDANPSSSSSTADRSEAIESSASSKSKVMAISNGATASLESKDDDLADTEMSGGRCSTSSSTKSSAMTTAKDALSVSAMSSELIMRSSSTKIRRIGKVGVDEDGCLLPGFEDVDDDEMAFCSESDFAIFIKQISSEIPLQRV